MDFAKEHELQESVATKSNIKYINVNNDTTTTSPPDTNTNTPNNSKLDDMVVQAANQAAMDMLFGQQAPCPNLQLVDTALYPERVTPQSDTIQSHQLVVIFESFDNLNFTYATPKAIFSNRNGHFHHDDFIGKPFGCKIRSRNNRGYGFVYLLKPTPELWARSLNHRTQIVHELDASMIVYYLNLRPNMTVCESGTGSGAMSHAILRTIAPAGHLYTFEFNKMRADTARQEFEKHGLQHLVTVKHKDVCGKSPIPTLQDGESTTNESNSSNNGGSGGGGGGGFGLPGQSVDAIFLDLPEPWLAIPHAAFCLKPNARIASYSPCMEQSQRTSMVLRNYGFHSLKTMEFRLREHYVDEVEYEPPPKDKRPRIEPHNHAALIAYATAAAEEGICGTTSGGEDTGAEADNERSEYETEGDQASLATAEGTFEDIIMAQGNEEPNMADTTMPVAEATTTTTTAAVAAATATTTATSTTAVTNTTTVGDGTATSATPTKTAAANPTNLPTSSTTAPSVPPPSSAANPSGSGGSSKRKKILVARPFVSMRGHTAFLTFATAGNAKQPDPNNNLQNSSNSTKNESSTVSPTETKK